MPFMSEGVSIGGRTYSPTSRVWVALFASCSSSSPCSFPCLRRFPASARLRSALRLDRLGTRRGFDEEEEDAGDFECCWSGFGFLSVVGDEGEEDDAGSGEPLWPTFLSFRPKMPPKTAMMMSRGGWEVVVEEETAGWGLLEKSVIQFGG